MEKFGDTDNGEEIDFFVISGDGVEVGMYDICSLLN